MAATTDQILAAVNLLSRKVDTVIQEVAIIMSQADDIRAATDLLNNQIPELIAGTQQVAALVQQLRDQVAAGTIPQDIMDGFDQALARLSPAVDAVSAIAAPPPEPPAGG